MLTKLPFVYNLEGFLICVRKAEEKLT